MPGSSRRHNRNFDRHLATLLTRSRMLPKNNSLPYKAPQIKKCACLKGRLNYKIATRLCEHIRDTEIGIMISLIALVLTTPTTQQVEKKTKYYIVHNTRPVLLHTQLIIALIIIYSQYSLHRSIHTLQSK